MAVSTSTPARTGGSPRRPWWSRYRWPLLAALVLLVVCLVPILMSGIDGAGRTWHPAGDWSVLELRTRDVGSSNTPLLGPYSRYGWNHPGPLLFWLLAVPYRLFGQSSSSMLLSAALVNVAAIIGLAIFAWRRGRLPLAAGAITGVAILCTHLGPSFLRDPWNPSITALPFAFVVMLAWSAWEGDGPAVPLLALGGSLLVQSHVGFAALVAALWVIGTVGFCRRRRGDWQRTVGWSAAVLVVCWVPVLVDQIAGTGNLSDLAHYFYGGSVEPAAGWGTAAKVIAKELGGIAPWLGGDERGGFNGGLVTTSAGSLIAPVVAFVAALAIAIRRRAHSAVRLQLVVLASMFVGFVSVARITGPVFAYLVRWLWVLALFWWLSIFWSLWSALFAELRSSVGQRDADSRRRWMTARRWATVGLVLLAFVVVTRTSVRTASGIDHIGTPDGEWYVTLDVISDEVVAGAPRDGPVLVRAVGSNNGSIGDAVRLQLERHGVPVVVDDDQRHKYGKGRLAKDHPPVAIMTVATGATLTGPLGATYGTPIATWDPLAPDERQFANALEDELADQLSLIGRDDLVTALRSGGSLEGAHDLEGVKQDLLQAVEQYRRQGDPVTVYVDRSVPQPAN